MKCTSFIGIRHFSNFPLLGFFICCLTWGVFPDPARSEGEKTFVGPDACKACHEKEFKTFFSFSKMAHSFKNLDKIKGLSTDEKEKCFQCHTTGYQKPGGFRSFQETPKMANSTCEACHGPGSEHAQTGDLKEIKGHLTKEDCVGCHDTEKLGDGIANPFPQGGVH